MRGYLGGLMISVIALLHSMQSIAQGQMKSSVTADKMNVLYAGIDNPITVYSNADWNNTRVTITNGTIIPTAEKGRYIVKVPTTGGTEIIVQTNNSVDRYPFRCKNVPDPTFMVGPSKGGILPTNMFKAQMYCRVVLENFDFDVRYNLVDVDVLFSGVGFEKQETVHMIGNDLRSISEFVKRCQPGTCIVFSNIQVSGSDGTDRKLPSVAYILQ